MVRVLASHQCGPGSPPGVDAICGLWSFAPRGFSLGTPFLRTPKRFVGKKITKLRKLVLVSLGLGSARILT